MYYNTIKNRWYFISVFSEVNIVA